MIYDPEDDDGEEEFELERYVYITVRKKECPKRLLTYGYVEFDRRLIDYQLKKKLIVDDHALLMKLVEDSLTDVPFFCREYKREYKFTYDHRYFQECTRIIEVIYPNKIEDSISYAVDSTNLFASGSDKFESTITYADGDHSVILQVQKEFSRGEEQEWNGRLFAEVEHEALRSIEIGYDSEGIEEQVEYEF